jgi:hypothetical protein
MDDYIQDVLDLVQFANGPGKRRVGGAALGDPDRSAWNTLAVGNEDHQDAVFRDRFWRIHRVGPTTCR